MISDAQRIEVLEEAVVAAWGPKQVADELFRRAFGYGP